MRALNAASVHVDLRIGGPDVAVIGGTRNGAEIPLLQDERWVA